MSTPVIVPFSPSLAGLLPTALGAAGRTGTAVEAASLSTVEPDVPFFTTETVLPIYGVMSIVAALSVFTLFSTPSAVIVYFSFAVNAPSVSAS